MNQASAKPAGNNEAVANGPPGGNNHNPLPDPSPPGSNKTGEPPYNSVGTISTIDDEHIHGEGETTEHLADELLTMLESGTRPDADDRPPDGSGADSGSDPDGNPGKKPEGNGGDDPGRNSGRNLLNGRGGHN